MQVQVYHTSGSLVQKAFSTQGSGSQKSTMSLQSLPWNKENKLKQYSTFSQTYVGNTCRPICVNSHTCRYTSTIMHEDIHVHVANSPSYPKRQSHLKLPCVLTQYACVTHSVNWHSSTSTSHCWPKSIGSILYPVPTTRQVSGCHRPLCDLHNLTLCASSIECQHTNVF